MIKLYIHPHTTNNFQVKWCCPRTELLVKQGLSKLSKLSEVHIVDSETKADFVIWHHVPQNNGQKSFELINRINPRKLVIIDSIDENDQYFVQNFHPSNYFLYFKRSIIKLVDQNGTKEKINLPERVFAWDYGILDGFLFPFQDKKIDVGCYLRPSCHNRAMSLYLMKRYYHSSNPAMVIGEVSQGSRSNDNTVYYDKTYFDYLAKTRIIVSSGPYAWTGCSRPSEAFANQCLYIADEAYRCMPNPPIEHNHWLQWSPQVPDSLYIALDWALSNPDAVEMIASDGYYHARQHHSSEARMKYVLEKIKEFS